MAIYHFTTGIIKAGKGKCAVASAAYISGSRLHDERLGRTFSYTRKEEVIYTNLMLPENAPAHLSNRAALWNEVERVQNRSNSRYARQFEMALPIELSIQEQIELAESFIRNNFTDAGMAADFAIHNKKGNPHLHVMCTVRGFKPDGSWANMEKKVFALDQNGERIPEIDPKTGKQKVRIRKGKGEEKIWKRVTVESNSWNSREQLMQWRKNWAEACNLYLAEENRIDHRSYADQGIERVPAVHEGYAARQIQERGGSSERVQENEEIRIINAVFEEAAALLTKAWLLIERIRIFLKEWRKSHEKGRSQNEDRDHRSPDGGHIRIQQDRTGAYAGAGKEPGGIEGSGGFKGTCSGRLYSRTERDRLNERFSEIRKNNADAADRRPGSVNGIYGGSIEELLRRAQASGAASECIIEGARLSINDSRSSIADSEADRKEREAERVRSYLAGKRRIEREEREAQTGRGGYEKGMLFEDLGL